MQLRISRFLTRHPNLLTLWVRKQSPEPNLFASPNTYTRTTIGESCDVLSPVGESYGVATFHFTNRMG